MTASVETFSSRADRPRGKSIRVLYSFPHKIGADRICNTAWNQVAGLSAAGADVLVYPGVLHKPLPANVKVWPTLAWGNLRISYKLLGTKRACMLHDFIVSCRFRRLADQVDIVHVWPLGALLTIKTAVRLGIPTVLERPNAHTRFAYEVVQRECERLELTMPRGHEHAYKADWLRIEEEEYKLADRLLCPSDFVAQTFVDRGFTPKKLVRHQYGFDETVFCLASDGRNKERPFTMLFAGGCSPRKGLHYALEAWLKSSAHKAGKFLIVGEFIPRYAEKLSKFLSHPSVQVLGFRKDVADLMRRSDVLILPSIEEGSALVTSEARGCGCVLLVSEAAGAICRHGSDSLVHRVGDIETLARHISLLYEDSALIQKLRTASLSTAAEITWRSAGRRLLGVYERVLEETRVHRGSH